MLQHLCDRLNEATGSPMVPWERVNDRNLANIGNYHISHAYGMYLVNRNNGQRVRLKFYKNPAQPKTFEGVN